MRRRRRRRERADGSGREGAVELLQRQYGKKRHNETQKERHKGFACKPESEINYERKNIDNETPLPKEETQKETLHAVM